MTRIDPLADDLEQILLRTQGLWEQLRAQHLFITGGTGLFGRWLLQALLHANAIHDLDMRIVVLTRDAAAFANACPQLANDPALTLHAGDVKDFDFPRREYAYIIHGATTSAHETFRGEDPLKKFDTLVSGTRHVLDFAAQCKVKRFLFLSSGVAYGVPPDNMDRIPETFHGAPDTTSLHSALGQAKRTAEFLTSCYAQQHGWNNSIARCFSFVGPYLPLDIHYAIGNFIGQALFDDKIVVKGDGQPMRSYLYMGDLVVWLLTLLLKGGQNEIYNLGSDQAISIGELAQLTRDTLSPQKEIAILGQSDLSVGNAVRNIYVPDISKARQAFGLDVWTSLQDAIRKTGRFYALQRDRGLVL